MPAETMCRAMALPSNLGRPSATITRKRLPARAASEKTVRSRDELENDKNWFRKERPLCSLGKLCNSLALLKDSVITKVSWCYD